MCNKTKFLPTPSNNTIRIEYVIETIQCIVCQLNYCSASRNGQDTYLLWFVRLHCSFHSTSLARKHETIQNNLIVNQLTWPFLQASVTEWLSTPTSSEFNLNFTAVNDDANRITLWTHEIQIVQQRVVPQHGVTASSRRAETAYSYWTSLADSCTVRRVTKTELPHRGLLPLVSLLSCYGVKWERWPMTSKRSWLITVLDTLRTSVAEST